MKAPVYAYEVSSQVAFHLICGKLRRFLMERFRSILRSRYTLAVVAGLIYAAAFPKLGIAGLAWIAPGLILFAARGECGGKAFRIGYLAGFVIWLVMLYWLLSIPYRWHGVPLGPAVGWIALNAYLGLYAGTWAWLCGRVQGSENQSTWMQRTSWALQCAAIWVGLEMLQARALSGFPWTLLGVSQYKLTPLIQIASVTGVYGVSFLVIWFSVSLLNAANVLIARKTSYRSLMAEVALPLLVVACLTSWGFMRMMEPTREVERIKLALVQPSIPQEVIWNPDANPARFEKLMRISEAAVKEKPHVLVWPEAAMPGFSREHFSAITNLIVQNKVWMIFGADDVEQKLEGGPNEMDFFNASFLFNPSGEFISRYRKLRLVMFGEYIPWSRWLPFLKYFTPIEGGFTPGKGPVQFQLGDLRAHTTVLICFEDVFPHYARHYVEDDTDFLLNITNDGWFGRSAAQWQHAATALFRTVENARPLIRCTNNGLTCWIDHVGRIQQIFRDTDGTVYGDGYLIVEVPLGIGKKVERTFYNRHGDWFGWGCVVLTVLLIGIRWRKKI
jgi:apolipoprotein N-acyltransferase